MPLPVFMRGFAHDAAELAERELSIKDVAKALQTWHSRSA